ncbi:MAG: T9SS type A sorting domain-containing protein, partial [Ignavibacteriales bacterium]|nr:T9SS type A sorting domain-containing protein [Ignavibacteriales bacterium]
IDDVDFGLGSETFIDNGALDLDPTQGVIIIYLETGDGIPSMRIIGKATEGNTTAYGFLTFENPAADFTMSGTIFSPENVPVPGAWIFAMNELLFFGDAANENGLYSLPLDSGFYYIHIEDMTGQYSSFDTVLVLEGNLTQNFHLRRPTSYIRGYVRDESDNPIPNIPVWVEDASDVYTDSNGQYIAWVSAGNGYIGVSNEVLPNYLIPNNHYYTIGDNDSIVNNEISDFVCLTANATITGTVSENGSSPTRYYMVSGGSWQLNSMTEAVINLNGTFSLPVHNNASMPMYNVFVNEDRDEYPFPPGMYSDTTYDNVAPGGVVHFNIVPAETSANDQFDGDFIFPAQWEWYNFNGTGGNTIVQCVANRLKVQCDAFGDLSGVGVMSKKPFRLEQRQYHFTVDHSAVGSYNSFSIMLSDKRKNWESPDNNENWLQLSWKKNPINERGWKLTQSQNEFVTTLWQTADTTGEEIEFIFGGADMVTLKINGVVKYSNTWANHLSLAYVYLFETNEEPNTPTPVYFDNFIVGSPTVGVRENGNTSPLKFALSQNYPNPFNPATTIRFAIHEQRHTILKIYNILGEEVTTLLNKNIQPGVYSVPWDASNLPSGMYFYRLTAGTFVETRKMVLLR